jgi:hypothetical protein
MFASNPVIKYKHELKMITVLVIFLAAPSIVNAICG